MRSLAENIRRGRKAIALARQSRMDTIDWERHLAELEQQHLLAWANALVEGAICYDGPLPLNFRESRLVPVWVNDPVGYVRRQLQALAFAHTMTRSDGFGDWRAPYWEVATARVLCALQAMHRRMQERRSVV